MFKVLSQGLVWVLLFSLGLSYAEEKITFTTYYPSPKGVYKTLKLFPITTPSACSEGELYYDNTTKRLRLCVPDGSGSYEWTQAPGGTGTGSLWKYNGAEDIYNDFNLNSGGVGIGTFAYSCPRGVLLARDVYLRDANMWAGDYIRACHWNGGYNYIYNTQQGRVGIGTTSPDARLTVLGSGNTPATNSLVVDYDTNPLGAGLLIRDDGNVGIGTVAPQARLDLATTWSGGSVIIPGHIRIADQTQGTDRVLTSDINGLASWQPQTDTRPNQGLYGYCVESGSPAQCQPDGVYGGNYIGIAQLPAYCDINTFRCTCPAGYTRLMTDSMPPNRYTCYKD